MTRTARSWERSVGRQAERSPGAAGSAPGNQCRVSASSASLVREAAKPRPLAVDAGNRIVTFDLARTAIIVVDMQNDSCHPDAWLAHLGVDLMPARRPIELLQRLLPPQWLEDVPVIWLNWGNRPDRPNLSPRSTTSITRPARA